ncbi:MAG: hypothetical protein DRI81_20255 [Chloroflexi bacterium]|nr:MAG: hypothetical protein DRI81_20255 [Chloroflexota bacterium]
MAIVILGKTPCAISGRIVSKTDKVLCLPPFPATLNDPAAVCSDACILRDEFEKWEFRDNVVRLVKEFWVQQHNTSEAFTVLHEDNEYLMAKGEVEAKTRILFLKHAFVIDIPQEIWQDFRGQLLGIEDAVSICPYSTIALSFNKRVDKMEICIEFQGGGKDCIELSRPEWSRFQSVLTTMEPVLG